jgi:hypothetical protein
MPQWPATVCFHLTVLCLLKTAGCNDVTTTTTTTSAKTQIVKYQMIVEVFLLSI